MLRHTESSSAAPEISVIVPHFEQRELLELCLVSLRRQSIDPPIFEILVIDNQSPGGLGDLPERFPDVRFVEEAQRGAAHARNAGLAVSRGRAIAFIDADCVADKHWLEEGLAALNVADLVGGRIDVTVRNSRAPTPVEAFERVFAFNQRDYVKRKGFAATANLFVSADVATRIGGFRHGVPEDLDWCQRAATLGFRLAFSDKAIVSHPARHDWGELVQKWERLIRERRERFGGRGVSRDAIWAILSILVAASAMAHLPRAAFSARLPSFRVRLSAAGTLFRIRFWRARKMLALLLTRTNGLNVGVGSQ